jgi:hypothetical protein
MEFGRGRFSRSAVTAFQRQRPGRRSGCPPDYLKLGGFATGQRSVQRWRFASCSRNPVFVDRLLVGWHLPPEAPECRAANIARDGLSGMLRNLAAPPKPEGKRMASGHTGNVVPRKGLRVRISCPPL